MAVRDGGCAFPGCGTPSGVVRCPSYCSLERWWPNGSRQPDLVVRSSPPDDAPHGMAGWRSDRIGKTVFYPPMSIDPYQQRDRREQPTHSGVNRDNRIHQHRGRTMPRCWCTFTGQIPTPQIPAPQIPALRTRASVAEGDTTSIARNSPAYRGYSSTGRVLIALKIHDAA